MEDFIQARERLSTTSKVEGICDSQIEGNITRYVAEPWGCCVQGGSLEVDLLADDASRIGLSERPSSKASSCTASPARVASPMRI